MTKADKMFEDLGFKRDYLGEYHYYKKIDSKETEHVRVISYFDNIVVENYRIIDVPGFVKFKTNLDIEMDLFDAITEKINEIKNELEEEN